MKPQTTPDRNETFTREARVLAVFARFAFASVLALATSSLITPLAVRLGLPLGAEEPKPILERLSSAEESVGRAAWESAASEGPGAIAALAGLANGENPEAAQAARRAIDRIAHAAAAPDSTTRTDAASALAAVALEWKLSLAVRKHALDLLGSVGVDATASALKPLLFDTELREDARKALERIPGDTAALTLVDGMNGATGEWLDALLLTLGTKRAAVAIPALARIVDAGAPGTVAAARALARIARADLVPLVIRVVKSATGRDRVLVTDDLVAMGDTFAREGNPELAKRIYTSVLIHAEDDAPRYAAIFALAGKDPSQNLALLMDATGDRSPRIRGLALDCLSKVQGADVDAGILQRLEGARGARKAVLLRVLAERKAPGLADHIAKALSDTDLDVKVTALELSGKLVDPANEAVIAEAFEKGSAEVRRVAGAAYLAMAEGKVASDPKAAEAAFLRIYTAATLPQEKGKALVGLASIGNLDHLEKAEAARKDPALSASATEALILFSKAIAKTDKPRAEELLLGILAGGGSRETLRAAMAALQAMGGDPTAWQKKQGLLSSWFIVGPFPNEGGKGFAAEYSPEKGVNLEEQIDEKERKRKWAEHHSTQVDGKVDLRQVFQRSNDVCAYAYAELEVPEARDIQVRVGSDDGIVVWLNGERVHANDAVRACEADQDRVDAKLKADLNTILLKITQGGGEWEFIFRLTDRDGKPLDLTLFKNPRKR